MRIKTKYHVILIIKYKPSLLLQGIIEIKPIELFINALTKLKINRIISKIPFTKSSNRNN